MRGAVTVVKCGGASGVDPVAVCEGVADRVRAGDRVVLVHGGSAEASALADRLGVPRREIRTPRGITSRRTDAATLDVLMMALAGRVKPALVTRLAQLGVPAVGLTGLDAGLLRATRKSAIRAVDAGRTVVVRDDRSGRITSVTADLPGLLLDAGIVPVVSPPALAEDGQPVNVNADRAAAALAVALSAERLVLLTATPGVLADVADETSVLPRYRLPGGEGSPGAADPAVGAGMTHKLLAAGEALRGGVAQVWVADGRSAESVRQALSGDSGTRVLAPSRVGEERVAEEMTR